MTYRDSLKHLIAEQQRQRLNSQLIQKALTTINEQLVKLELNKINGHQVVQFFKKLYPNQKN
jgi:hypothetical protein